MDRYEKEASLAAVAESNQLAEKAKIATLQTNARVEATRLRIEHSQKLIEAIDARMSSLRGLVELARVTQKAYGRSHGETGGSRGRACWALRTA